MEKLECKGKDGKVRYFEYKYEFEHSNNSWSFHVYSPKATDFFELKLVPFNQSSVKIIQIRHNDQPELMAKGIPESIILKASEITGKKIISSSNNVGPGEWRSEHATKVWKRLEKGKHAVYDPVSSRYSTL